MMNKKHLLVFALGIFAGAFGVFLVGTLFFPAQTKAALNSIHFSLSELDGQNQTVFLKPISFLGNIAGGLAGALPDGLVGGSSNSPKFSYSLLTQSGVISLTNAERTQNGLPILTENSKLDQVALAKAKDMFTKQYFAHISPSGQGPSDLDTEAGYSYIVVGENLAEGDFADDTDLLAAWMASPGHRANILNKQYRDLGVAVLQGNYQGNTVWMAVQEFGMPSLACPSADASIKSQIVIDEARLNTDTSTLLQEKAQLDKLGTSVTSAEVNQYNALVAAYNSLITQTQQLVSGYNAEVNVYNICAQGGVVTAATSSVL
jgi:uncharacterized protein YkwD